MMYLNNANYNDHFVELMENIWNIPELGAEEAVVGVCQAVQESMHNI